MQTVTNDSISWRLRDVRPSPDGALTRDQMSALGSTHGFGPDQMLDLSKSVDIGLDRHLDMTFLGLVAERRQRGARELTNAIKHLATAERNLAKALEIIKSVRSTVSYGIAGDPSPDREHREALEQAQTAISETRSHYAVAVRAGLVTYTAHPDMRRTYDIRREIVCTAIFDVWTEADRSLTYTTDPISSQRGGPLVEFVNAVVEYITDPTSTLTGEAIKTEIERFKSYADQATAG